MTQYYLGASPTDMPGLQTTVDSLADQTNQLPAESVSPDVYDAQQQVYSALAQINALVPPEPHDEWMSPRQDVPVLFENADYGGRSQSVYVTAGEEGGMRLPDVGMNDKVSSVHIPPHWLVVLHRNVDTGGGSFTFTTEDTPKIVNLRGTGIDNAASSVSVRNLWPARYASLKKNYDDAVASLTAHLNNKIALWRQYLEESETKAAAVTHKYATEEATKDVQTKIVASDVASYLQAREMAETLSPGNLGPIAPKSKIVKYAAAGAGVLVLLVVLKSAIKKR